MIKRVTATILFLLLVFSTVAIADSDVPQPPHRFMGYVTDENGNLVEDNSTVSALVNGQYFNTTVKDGKYGYTLLTEEFLVEGYEGDDIYFFINGTPTQQIAFFESGGLNIGFSKYLNLTLVFSPLTISSVSSSSITETQAIITWNTDKLSNSIINYGTTKALEENKNNNSYTLNHEIILNNLQSGTKYYFEVLSYDYSGFYAIDNNSGAYYSFNTVEDSNGGDNGGDNGGSSSDNGNNEMPPMDDIQPENKPPAIGSIGPYYGAVNRSITFDASNSDDQDGHIVEYNWNFGDGTDQKTSSTTTTHNYSMAGTYAVTLTIKDDDGATNSTATTAYISVADTDDDGWTDEAEDYYGTDATNSSSFPTDADGDGIPDEWDSDDDNDGLTDNEEELIGSQSTDGSDVLRIINDYDLFYLVDINNDGVIDHYYNKSTGVKTQLKKTDENKFLIDVDNDGKFDYLYDLSLGEILIYKNKDKSQQFSTIYIILILVILILVILIIYFIKKNKK